MVAGAAETGIQTGVSGAAVAVKAARAQAPPRPRPLRPVPVQIVRAGRDRVVRIEGAAVIVFSASPVVAAVRLQIHRVAVVGMARAQAETQAVAAA